MLGELSSEQIERVLRSGGLGRIGCHSGGRTYVVPVSYAYNGEYVYAHSADGLKIRTMRANPEVCFEVEEVDDHANWRCVILWGTYEELSGPAEERARAALKSRFEPFVTSETAHPTRNLPRSAEDVDEVAVRSVFYRIRPTEKTGRFEKQ